MALTTSPRLGLTRWGAQTDPFRRAQLDADHGILDTVAAMYAQGVFNARPAAGKAGRFYYSTDTGHLTYDTGSAWVVTIPNVVDTSRLVSAGLGLTGGGSLAADRTLAVDFAASGTSSATKAVRADDSRLSDARTPVAHDAGLVTSGVFATARIPTVPVAQGGTGATTAATALVNLGVTATAAELNKLDGAIPTVTEINYLDGVTSAIQTQINGKAATVHTHAAADTTSGTFAIARIPTGQTSTTVPLGNDARFTDARTPTAHVHAAADTTSGVFADARIPAEIPRGTIGYAERLTTLSITQTVMDVTGLSVTVTVAASRRIRITADLFFYAGLGTGVVAHINEGATTLQQRAHVMAANNYAEFLTASVILTPTAGAHTYKIRASGTAASTLQAATSQPNYILVEDIGAA